MISFSFCVIRTVCEWGSVSKKRPLDRPVILSQNVVEMKKWVGDGDPPASLREVHLFHSDVMWGKGVGLIAGGSCCDVNRGWGAGPLCCSVIFSCCF